MLTRFMPMITAVALLAGCSGSAQPTIDKSNAAQARLQLGLAYLARGDMKSAHQNLERAIGYAPNDYQTQMGMALYSQQVGENDSAEHYYQRALSLSPNNRRILNNYGAFLCSLRQYDAAHQQFSAAINLSDSSQVADSLENAGYCFLQANQVSEAKVMLARAFKIDPNKGVAMLIESEQLFEQGKHPQSKTLLDIYQHELPASAHSLWLNIRFAALDENQRDINGYGEQLAQHFPHSTQYQQFLANEY